MLQTLMVRLDPDDEQYKILLETMHRFNEACNYIAEVAYSIGKANKYVVHNIASRAAVNQPIVAVHMHQLQAPVFRPE